MLRCSSCINYYLITTAIVTTTATRSLTTVIAAYQPSFFNIAVISPASGRVTRSFQTTAVPSSTTVLSRRRSGIIRTGLSVSSSFSSTTTRLFSSPTLSKLNGDHDSTSMSNLKFIDIGANLLDDRYIKGIYYDKQRHEPDLDLVIERAINGGVTHLIITAGTLHESYKALQLVRNLRDKYKNTNNNNEGTVVEEEGKKQPIIQFGCTVGIHPTRCKQEFIDLNADDDISDDATFLSWHIWYRVTTLHTVCTHQQCNE